MNQFNNPANPLAHETTTGPEIWAQTGHDVDAVVCGVGSGGTITGLEPFLRPRGPASGNGAGRPSRFSPSRIHQVGRIGEAGSWVVEGIGEDFVPPIADLTPVRHAYTITDAESSATARALLKQEGILAGSSSGTLVAGALKYCREQTKPKRVVTLVCDSGNKYLSKMFNDFWMADRGFVTGKNYGDLRDVISHRFAEGAVISIGPDEPLNIAYTRMRLYDVSQLPVLEGTKVAGILDESDLLLALTSDAGAFRRPVREFMTTKLQTVRPTSPIEELLPVFDAGHVAIVSDEENFYGLITRVDVVSYLRRQHQPV